ncbi:unnamed protein product, partial [Mesorhabditis belari]|uniref:GMEB1/2/Spe-44-like domain-containing protein n=1 Tax=Mesorhabditis belari TaxID=2138241 RepID=A0AAF3FPJ4_9BILA
MSRVEIILTEELTGQSRGNEREFRRSSIKSLDHFIRYSSTTNARRISNEEILHRLPPTPDNVGRIMHSDATTFWSQMQQVGLLDDIVDTMLAEVDTVRNETRVHNITPRVCGTLSRLCSALDLTANVAARLRSRHTPINANVLPPPEITHIGERKRSLDEGLMVRPLANQMIPELKRPRTHYPPVIQSPLIEALLKVQTTYQLHQTPFANMDLC